MGALPWTLRTTAEDTNDNQVEPMVATSESSPLPKSANTTDLPKNQRRGSLNDILTTKAPTSNLSNVFTPDILPTEANESTDGETTTITNSTTSNHPN